MIVGIVVGLVSIALILYEVFTASNGPSEISEKEHDECIDARKANE